MTTTAEPWQMQAPVTPFWRRMPKFFVFPAARAPMIRIVGGGVACGIAGWVFGRNLFTSPAFGTLFLFAVLLAVSVFVARYGFLVIERTAAGYLHPSQYPEFGEQGSPYRPYKMFLVMMVVPVLIGIVGAIFTSPLLTALLFIAFAALLPASTIVMTMTDSFFEAINPARALEVARKIGKPYWALCLFLLLLMASSQQASELLMPKLLGPQAQPIGPGTDPTALAGALGRAMGTAFFVAGFVGNYFFILMCALIGYAMYQYADRLGVSVVGPGEAATTGRVSSREHQRRLRDAMIGQMVAAGEIREAIDMLNDDLRDRPGDLSLHARLHKLLLIEGSLPRIEDHTERYIELLIKSDNARQALPLAEEAYGRKSDWEPRRLEHVAPLARAALESGKPQLAARLIRGFDRKHRMHPDIPQIYLIGAKLLVESGHAAQAQRVLDHLIANHGDSPVAAEAKRLAERLTQLAQPSKA
ncbi:MAG: tetratricopeptide repeat protein [Burkholderiaceae bacterium]